MPSLLAIRGPLAGERFEIGDRLVVGREEGDVVIADDEVSRAHAVLRRVPGGVEIEDLDSTNGTFVDGSRIAGKQVVTATATVKVGTSSFRVEIDAPAAAPAGGTRIQDRPDDATRQRPIPVTPPPAPPPPVAAPAAPVSTATAPPASEPAFAPKGARGTAAASRRPTFVLMTYGLIAADAIALMVYFGTR